MVTAFSDHATAIVRSVQSVLHALDDLKSSAEREQIYAVIVAHVRSAMPMVLGAAAVIEPVNEIVHPLGDGARYELRRRGEWIDLYVHDAFGHDVDVGL